jgi:hypothetical protein
MVTFLPHVLLGENHRHAGVREYLAHYHEERNHQDEERNHQGLAGQLILPPANPQPAGTERMPVTLPWTSPLIPPQRGMKRHD